MGRAIPFTLLFAVLAAGFFSPAIDAQACSGSLVKDLAAVANKYNIGYFVSLLSDVNGLGAGPYTFFAPVDAVLQPAVQALGLGDAKNWTAEQKYIVTNVLFYHIAPGTLATADISSKFGASLNTLANNLRLCSAGSTLMGDKNITDNFDSLMLTRTVLTMTKSLVTVKAGIDSADVVTADIKLACQPNVLINTINKVLMPCDFSKYLTMPLPALSPPLSPKHSPSPKAPASPAPCKLGSLVNDLKMLPEAFGAQVAAILPPTFKGTVFVPSDVAALALATTLKLNLAGLQPLQNNSAYKDILSYHVVPTAVLGLPPLVPGATVVPTALASIKAQTFCKKASPGTLSLTIGTSVLVTGASGDAKVIKSIQTCSGAIHIVNAVLLPCTPATSNLQAILAKVAAPASPPATVLVGGSSPPITLVGGSKGSINPSLVSGSGNISASNTSASNTSASTPLAKKSGAGAVFAPAAMCWGLVLVLLSHML